MNRVGTALKLIVICALLSVLFAALATGSTVARAQETTVEIEDATVDVGDNSSVDIWVRNYPTVPDVTPYGLGVYTIRVDFDPLAVNVTNVSPGDAPFNAPTFGIYDDYVSITQFHTQWPGPDGDIKLCDLEFTCLAEGETTLALTVQTLAHVNGGDVEHTVVDGTINQLVYEVETFIGEEQDIAQVVVLPVTIVRVKDPVTEETVPGVQIADYVADLTFTPGFMEILDIRGGDPPFDTIPPENIVIDNVAGTASVSNDVSPNGALPPIVIFRIVARLTGSCLVSDDLSVNVAEVSTPDGATMNAQDQPMVLTFQRGDIHPQNPLSTEHDIRLLNMASVHHDGTGDIPDIIDCLFIAQYMVGIRNEYFELVP